MSPHFRHRPEVNRKRKWFVGSPSGRSLSTAGSTLRRRPSWENCSEMQFLRIIDVLCGLRRWRCVFTLSVPLSVLMSVPCLHRLARRALPTMAVGQHAVRAGESISLPTWTRPRASESIPCKNEIVRGAGKSIIQMLLWEHWMTIGGLQLSSSVSKFTRT